MPDPRNVQNGGQNGGEHDGGLPIDKHFHRAKPVGGYETLFERLHIARNGRGALVQACKNGVLAFNHPNTF